MAVYFDSIQVAGGSINGQSGCSMSSTISSISDKIDLLSNDLRMNIQMLSSDICSISSDIQQLINKYDTCLQEFEISGENGEYLTINTSYINDDLEIQIFKSTLSVAASGTYPGFMFYDTIYSSTLQSFNSRYIRAKKMVMTNVKSINIIRDGAISPYECGQKYYFPQVLRISNFGYYNPYVINEFTVPKIKSLDLSSFPNSCIINFGNTMSTPPSLYNSNISSTSMSCFVPNNLCATWKEQFGWNGFKGQIYQYSELPSDFEFK